MNDIVCLHRPRNNFSSDVLSERAPELGKESYVQGLAIWSTCQREIIVTDLLTAEDRKLFSHGVSRNDQIFTGSDAYQFLLEIISGLHSKLVGETEILGQFKIFLQDLENNHSAFFKMHRGFFQSLLTDTKKVRDLHLKNLGAQSYGSLVRRSLRESDNVVVFGGGQLAAEILPWLDKKSKVRVVVRNTEKAQKYLNDNVKTCGHFDLVSLQDWVHVQPEEQVAWVVAAPLPSDTLRGLLGRAQGVKRVIDLRGEEELSANDQPEIEYLGFSTVISQIETFNSQVKERTQAALHEIKLRTEKFRTFAIHHPKGWDDLCA